MGRGFVLREQFKCWVTEKEAAPAHHRQMLISLKICVLLGCDWLQDCFNNIHESHSSCFTQIWSFTMKFLFYSQLVVSVQARRDTYKSLFSSDPQSFSSAFIPAIIYSTAAYRWAGSFRDRGIPAWSELFSSELQICSPLINPQLTAGDAKLKLSSQNDFFFCPL